AFSYPFERITTCNTVTTEQKSTGGPVVSREIFTSWCLLLKQEIRMRYVMYTYFERHSVQLATAEAELGTLNVIRQEADRLRTCLSNERSAFSHERIQIQSQLDNQIADKQRLIERLKRAEADLARLRKSSVFCEHSYSGNKHFETLSCVRSKPIEDENDFCSQTESESEAMSIVSTIQTTRGTQDPAKKIQKGVTNSAQASDYWTQKLEEARQRLASLQCESEKLESAYDRWRASNVDKTVKFGSLATNNKPTTSLFTAGSTSLTTLPTENLKTHWNQCDPLAPAFSYPFERITTCNTVTTEQKSTGGPVVSREIFTSCAVLYGPEVIVDGQWRRFASPSSDLSIEINDVVENSRPPPQPTPVLSAKLSDAATCEASCFELESKSNIHQNQLCTSGVRCASLSGIPGNRPHSAHVLDLSANKAPLSTTSSSTVNEQKSYKTTERICLNTLQQNLSIFNRTNRTETVMTDSDDSDLNNEHDVNRSAALIRNSMSRADISKTVLRSQEFQMRNPQLSKGAAENFSASEYEHSQSEDDRLSVQVPEMDNLSTAREDSFHLTRMRRTTVAVQN
ncbi:hypothetical protein AHF37_01099, partial [Paragonimus kellicotti]